MLALLDVTSVVGGTIRGRQGGRLSAVLDILSSVLWSVYTVFHQQLCITLNCMQHWYYVLFPVKCKFCSSDKQLCRVFARHPGTVTACWRWSVFC